MASPIIIDCDPGVDDAIALLFAFGHASPDLGALLGITTVAGNVPLALTFSNARKICALAGKPNMPVYAGCPRPILRPLATAEEVHGANGLQGADLNEPTTEKQTLHGVDFLIATLLEAPDPVRIAALGPLTNIAIALIKCPQIAEKIAQIVIMGGAIKAGNITPAAEFNIHVDPHAAAVVFAAGIATTLITLDTTHQVLTTPERLDAIREIGNPASTAAAGMLSFYGQGDRQRDGLAGAPLHDPCVMAYLLAPELFTTRPAAVTVETEGDAVGRTIVDWVTDGKDAPIQVVEKVDAAGVYALVLSGLASFS
ncbi:MAG: nucleoside hydrolase [Phormidesmis sp.]